MTEDIAAAVAWACVWAAFALVCLAVALTGGRSGGLLRIKLRLGGLLLVLTPQLLGCPPDRDSGIACYEGDTDTDMDTDSDSDSDSDADTDTDADADPNVRINEIAAGDDGWIELYNADDRVYDISQGWMITNAWESGVTDYYPFPEGTEIQPGEFLLLQANGVGTGLELDFVLDPAGGIVTLVLVDDWFIAQDDYPALEPGTSYARSRDGGLPWEITDQPTPGASNEVSEQP